MKTRLRNLQVAALVAGMTALAACGSDTDAAGDAEATFSPSSSVEMVIPFTPGGGVDLAGRRIASTLTDEDIVDVSIQPTNYPGGSSAVGMSKMSGDYAGDPHVLAIVTPTSITGPILTGSGVTLDNVTPLARIFSEFGTIAVRADSPIESMDDFVDAWKGDPTGFKIGGPSVGSTDHVTIGKLAVALGIDPEEMNFTAYDGGSGVPALLGGHLDAIIAGNEFIDYVESGDARALAITPDEPVGGRFEGIPTLKESGIDVSQTNWRMVIGPKDMPAAAVEYWREALADMVATESWSAAVTQFDWSDNFLADGAELADFLKTERADYESILKQAGLA